MLNFVDMRKADLVSVFGTFRAIGDLFKPFNQGKPLTKSAISLWGDEIPELREFQVRKVVPDIDNRIVESKKRRPRKAA